VIGGGGVAGLLAANESGHAKRAGIGAGLLGTIPAFAWSSASLRSWFATSASEGGLIFAGVLLCILVLATAVVAILLGVFGGFFGRWIAGNVDPELNG
jgi:hypothetical protein